MSSHLQILRYSLLGLAKAKSSYGYQQNCAHLRSSGKYNSNQKDLQMADHTIAAVSVEGGRGMKTRITAHAQRDG